ncbi:MAG: nucleotide-binding universal stress UspA family protein [Gammaproteobacteria bacterium]|jgi:nucleotide-binding universal stress UspA family protein
MRVIFVPVADRPECAAALSTAFRLGKSVGASVVGCHIRLHRHSPVAVPSLLEPFGDANDDAQWQAAWKPKDSETTGIAAKTLFTQVAQHYGYDVLRNPRAKPGAVWMEKTGAPQKVIGIMGPVADLLVVSRPSPKGGALAQLFLSASLLKSSRPVLVLPQAEKRTIGKRICIAWNQSTEAARAVTAAMPLLSQADQVSIVTCGAENRVGPTAKQLAAYLKYWGVTSERFSTEGKDQATEIIANYKSTHSDLLVMGAYSRNRMRQLVFGGLTDYMLKRMSIPIPILMLHS